MLLVVMSSALGLVFGWGIFNFGRVAVDGMSSDTLGGAIVCAALTGLFTAVALANE